MAEQKKKETRPSKPAEGGEGGNGSAELAKKGKKIKEDIDRLLDEIDDILEENAEEFVKSYVQRGGESHAELGVPQQGVRGGRRLVRSGRADHARVPDRRARAGAGRVR